MNVDISEKAKQLISSLRSSPTQSRKESGEIFSSYFADLFTAHPIAQYIALIDSTQRGHSMYSVSPEVGSFRQSLLRTWGDVGLEIYHRATMLALMDDFVERARPHNYPDSIINQFRLSFARIESNILESDLGKYRHDNDSFLKDFTTCVQSAFPGGGAWVIDHRGGFTRSTALKGGIAQFFRLTWMYLFVTRGHQPMYSLHIHNDLAHLHTQEERKACHLRLAEMLRNNPHVKGICGSSWLTDPVVAKISPRLNWVRSVPEANGCRYYYVGPDIEGGALTRSRTRQKLFEEGKYLPTRYLNIWARDSMIAWAKRETGDSRSVRHTSVRSLPES